MTVADSLPAAGNAWGERMETPEDVAVMLRFSEMGWGGEADRVRARLQTAIDCHSRYAWARLYPNKLPVTAVQLLNDDVLPTFEAHQARIEVVLSDNGRQFCGRDDHHPYELFLQLEGIAQKCTRVKRPQAMASSAAAPCSTNTSASRAAKPGPRPSTRCRPSSMTI